MKSQFIESAIPAVQQSTKYSSSKSTNTSALSGSNKKYDASDIIVDTTSDDRCGICHGSGICQACMGKRRYYVTGYGVTESEYVDCQACKGTGKCKYCNK